MVYKHGVYNSERPTSLVAPVEATAGLQIYVGTAPINLAQSNEYVNKPLLAFSYDEAVKQLGYSSDWENYTLCEAMDSSFNLYGVAPVVFINVLDPEKHRKTVEPKSIPVLNNKAVLKESGVLLNTLVVKLDAAGEELVKGTDYLSTFDNDGRVIITAVPGGKITSNQTELTVSFSMIDPSMVTKSEVIGGTDVNTGQITGLELVDSVFPKFGLVPGQILAPKFSIDSTVEAVMKAKAGNINSFFKAVALVDADTKEANTYTKVSEWKNRKNYTAENEIVCWPKVALGDKVYHLSTQLAGLAALTDSQNDDLPYVSPSNKSLQMNRAVLKDGTEVNLGPDQAAYLNGQGIFTALNFIGGWKGWGNRTAAYPAVTDVKDTFIPVRRMHNWVANTIVLSTWQNVDDPTNTRLIDTVVDSINIWLNGLTSSGALVGGRIEFRRDQNPLTDLINGTIRFHVALAEPTPGENIEFVLEFDATYYSRLFQ